MQALPANRTAALALFISGLTGAGTALAGVYPNGATEEIALISGGVATIAGPLSHIIGSWLWDRTPAGQASVAPVPIPRVESAHAHGLSPAQDNDPLPVGPDPGETVT